MTSKQLLQASKDYLNKDSFPIIDGNGVQYVRLPIKYRMKLMALGFCTVSVILPDGTIGYMIGSAYLNPVEFKYRWRIFVKEVQSGGLAFGISAKKNEIGVYLKRRINYVGGFFR